MHLYTYDDMIRILDYTKTGYFEEPTSYCPWPTLILSMAHYGEVILSPSPDGLYPNWFGPHIYPSGTIQNPNCPQDQKVRISREIRERL